MSRFPPIPPSKLTPVQKEGYDEIERLTQQTFGSTLTLKNEEGAFIGPFAPLLYTPSLIQPWLNLAHQAFILPSLTERERELAILVVLSHTRPNFPLYAHSKLGEKAGLTTSQVSDARTGKLPSDLSEIEVAAFEFAKGIVEQMKSGGGGPVSDEVFEGAKKVLGQERTAAVIHTVASFMYSSVLFNAGDVPAPE